MGLVYRTKNGPIVLDLYPATSTNPKGEYQEEIDLGVANSSLIEVQGQPAIVTQPGTDVPGTNPAWLRFALSGVDVNLYCFKCTTEDLIQVADTVRMPGS